MLTSSYPKYPGETTAPFIEEIAAGLARRGHEVHVVAPFHRHVQRAPIERGVHLHFFRYSPTENLNVWGYAESLHADVKLRRRTLVAAPLALGASVVALLRLMRGSGVRGQGLGETEQSNVTAPRPPTTDHRRRSAEKHIASIVNRQSQIVNPFDVVHAHWVLPNGVPAAVAARICNVPLVISLHGSDVYLAEQSPPLSLTASAALREAAAITACSGDLRDRALRLGARPGSVAVIPYGVDPQAFRPDPEAAALVRAELGLAPDTPMIITVSRLVYKKGLTYLLDAFPTIYACHPEAVLVIAGYGDLRDELEHRAHELGVASRVYFPGQLDRERAARYISAADVYVVPSIRDQGGNVDGLPNALLEGMGAARPIVASRVAGIPDVINDGEHGLLTPERDAPALAAAITRLLNAPDLAQRLGHNARQRILHELTCDVTAERFEQVYLESVKRER
jgi:glycosyltransferase involved in cell wall biosynthesis